MNSRPRRFNRKLPYWTVPAALLALALIAFAPLIPRLGFYWDDWAQVFSYRAFGAGGFWTYFSSDRPLSAWTHVLFSPVFGSSAPAWHFFTLGLRWLAAVSFYWLLCETWPARRWVAAAAALLFLVYPAFSQQSIAVAYHQHWLQYLLFLLSLAASTRAQRRPDRFRRFTLLALLAQVLQLSITEYFVFSELLRPVIFYFIRTDRHRAETTSRRLARTLLHSLPYLAVLAGFVVWRLFLLQIPGNPNTPRLLQEFLQAPLAALGQLAHLVLWDTFWILVSSWARVFNLTLEQTSQPFTLAAWGAGLLAAAAVTVYLARLDRSSATDEAASGQHLSSQPDPSSPQGEGIRSSQNFFLQALLLGGLAVLLGPAPEWMLGGFILDGAEPYHADRYALAATLGAALLLAALIDWLGRARLQKAVLAGALIGLSVSFQLREANDYRWLWVDQSRFFQQLAWRAPVLVPGTALVTEEIIFPFQGNFSTAAALNLLYPQTRLPDQVDYWVYALLPRLEKRSPSSGPAAFKTQVRTSHFSGSTAASLFIENGAKRQNCLWMLRPIDRLNPYLSDFYKSWLADTVAARIRDAEVDASGLPGPGFDTRPSSDWCYFYEKSELAIQLEDWARAAELGDSAQRAGYQPLRSPSDSAREWIAFIEGYARAGRPEAARDLTLQAYQSDPDAAGLLCGVWQPLSAFGSPPAELGCQNR